jgi:uncharacterized membrane-anchored protein
VLRNGVFLKGSKNQLKKKLSIFLYSYVMFFTSTLTDNNSMNILLKINFNTISGNGKISWFRWYLQILENKFLEGVQKSIFRN